MFRGRVSRPSWTQLTRAGIPALFVVRPSNFTPGFGEEVLLADSDNKVEVMRLRQLYQQGHLGVKSQLDLAILKNPNLALATKGIA